MRNFIITICLLVVGCGPVTKPMVTRLDEDQQRSVDAAWECMFSPPDRLDSTLLLDVLIANQAHQLGVDSLWLISEKRVSGGLIIMDFI